MLKITLETLSAPASEGCVSMGIPVFSHVVVYERLKVFQRVGLISVALRVGMKRLATPRVLGFMLRGHAVPRLVECCRDTSLTCQQMYSQPRC